MGSRLEILKHLPETIRKDHSGGINSSEIWTNRPLMAEAASEVRIGEISRILLSEEERTRKADKNPRKTNNNGFEPFVNPEPTDNPLFVNGYDGNFSQQMELNRRGIERVLKIAHLDGKVVLTSLNPLKQRSIEANPDGSVTRKRNLFFGEKIEGDNKENPIHRVAPVSAGWKIEVNDTRIREELGKKNLTGKKNETEFIRRFNKNLRAGILECIIKEKLSNIKDGNFYNKVFDLALNLGITSILIWPLNLSPIFYSTIFLFLNLSKNHPYLRKFIHENVSAPFYRLINREDMLIDNYFRKIDHPLEYFMLPIEIDKVARSFAFLNLKGRTLVKETKPETKK